MIVPDASAVVHLLLGTPQHATFLSRTLVDPHWAVPEHFLVEVASGVRGSWLGHDIDDSEFDRLIVALSDLRLDVWPTLPLLPRIRQLAHNATTYDACYLALAEELAVSFVTTDMKLIAVPAVGCRVEHP